MAAVETVFMAPEKMVRIQDEVYLLMLYGISYRRECGMHSTSRLVMLRVLVSGMSWQQ